MVLWIPESNLLFREHSRVSWVGGIYSEERVFQTRQSFTYPGKKQILPGEWQDLQKSPNVQLGGRQSGQFDLSQFPGGIFASECQVKPLKNEGIIPRQRSESG